MIARAGGLCGAALLMAGFLQAGSTLTAAAAGPVNLVVTTNADGAGVGSCTTPGPCTLRQAIDVYNADATTGDPYTITFSASTDGTPFNIGSLGALTITDSAFPANPLTITGDGTALTVIDAGSLSGGIIVSAANHPAVTLTGMTIQHAATAPAVTNGTTGGLTLTNVDVNNNSNGAGNAGILNSAGALLNATNVEVNNNNTSGAPGGGIANGVGSTFNATGLTAIGNTTTGAVGGGIMNGGTFTGTGLDVENNHASNGGGIFNSATGVLNLGTTTISGGIVDTNVVGAGDGGGIDNNGGTATLDGVSVNGNITGAINGGGVYTTGPLSATGGSISLNNASGDGGGLWVNVASTVNLTNEAINGNTAAGSNGGGGVYDGGQALNVSGGSISSNNATTATSAGGGVDLNEVSTAFQSVFSDVAIDNNQAGLGGGIESGDPLVVNQGSDISNNKSTHGQGGGVEVIGIGTGPTCTATVSVTPAPVLPVSRACFDDTTINDNEATSGALGEGGGILSIDTATLVTNGSVSDNAVNGGSADAGAGVAQGGVGTLTLVSETVNGNTDDIGAGTQRAAGVDVALNANGGIYFTSVSNNTIQGTTLANAQGSGIDANTTGTVTLAYDTIDGNSGAYEGSGIYNAANTTLTNSTVANNSMPNNGNDQGAGVFATGAFTLAATNDTVTGNTGAFNGGGFYNAGSTINLNNVTVSDNQATQLHGTGGVFTTPVARST